MMSYAFLFRRNDRHRTVLEIRARRIRRRLLFIVQLTHRILAYLLFLHALGLLIGTHRRRDEAPIVRNAMRLTFATIVLQVLASSDHVPESLFPSGEGTRIAMTSSAQDNPGQVCESPGDRS